MLQKSLKERQREIESIRVGDLVRAVSNGDLGVGTVVDLSPPPGLPRWRAMARVHMADAHWNGADLYVDVAYLYRVTDPVTALGLLEKKP